MLLRDFSGPCLQELFTALIVDFHHMSSRFGAGLGVIAGKVETNKMLDVSSSNLFQRQWETTLFLGWILSRKVLMPSKCPLQCRSLRKTGFSIAVRLFLSCPTRIMCASPFQQILGFNILWRTGPWKTPSSHAHVISPAEQFLALLEFWGTDDNNKTETSLLSCSTSLDKTSRAAFCGSSLAAPGTKCLRKRGSDFSR